MRTGDVSAEEPAAEARPPHPEPRVIVNALSVRGPHGRAAVERAARFGWGRIVQCYKSIDDQARGAVTVELVVTGDGRVASSRRIATTLENKELASCLTKTMRKVAMPQARARSVAKIEIKVAPGDPPVSDGAQ